MLLKSSSLSYTRKYVSRGRRLCQFGPILRSPRTDVCELVVLGKVMFATSDDFSSQNSFRCEYCVTRPLTVNCNRFYYNKGSYVSDNARFQSLPCVCSRSVIQMNDPEGINQIGNGSTEEVQGRLNTDQIRLHVFWRLMENSFLSNQNSVLRHTKCDQNAHVRI